MIAGKRTTRLKLNINRRQAVLLLINGVMLLIFALLTGLAHKEAKKLYSQQAADRWGEDFAQVSAFFSPECGMNKEGVFNLRSALVEQLSKDSLNEAGNGGRVWIDAYSGECESQLRRENTMLTVTAVGVGGDYFRFHPMRLLSGSYISDEDLNHDRIVVDENFAWAMFGSNDIVGMQVWMGEETFFVAGVVAVEEDSLFQTAYGEGNRIYMSYDYLQRQRENLQVSCYEAVMPNPISNYAYYALRTACGIQEEEEDTIKKTENPMNFDSIEVLENSNRYTLPKLAEGIKTLRLRSMRTNSVKYPYWENIARVTEEQQILLFLIRALLLVFPFICLIILLRRLWKARTWTAKSVCLGLVERIREKYEIRRIEKEEAEKMPETGDEDTAEADEMPGTDDGDMDIPDEEEWEEFDEAEDEAGEITEAEDEVPGEPERTEEMPETDDEDTVETDGMPEAENEELRSVTGKDIFTL
ncbi:MAG: ABC transporter permease [Bacteroidales bacterium]|nr:ABC transporter permease [Clostridium sp.]MCM1204477.1 ABC transporter permease [Bacteroidales bacterium]